MYVILRRKDQRLCQLVLHEDIFPRPTPWRIAFHSFYSFLKGEKRYQFAIVPPTIKLFQYEIDVEGNELVLRQGNVETLRMTILDMTWALWFDYEFQSFIHGLFLQFWNWRWREGTLTREEAEYRVDHQDE